MASNPKLTRISRTLRDPQSCSCASPCFVPTWSHLCLRPWPSTTETLITTYKTMRRNRAHARSVWQHRAKGIKSEPFYSQATRAGRDQLDHKLAYLLRKKRNTFPPYTSLLFKTAAWLATNIVFTSQWRDCSVSAYKLFPKLKPTTTPQSFLFPISLFILI